MPLTDSFWGIPEGATFKGTMQLSWFQDNGSTPDDEAYEGLYKRYTKRSDLLRVYEMGNEMFIFLSYLLDEKGAPKTGERHMYSDPKMHIYWQDDRTMVFVRKGLYWFITEDRS